MFPLLQSDFDTLYTGIVEKCNNALQYVDLEMFSLFLFVFWLVYIVFAPSIRCTRYTSYPWHMIHTLHICILATLRKSYWNINVYPHIFSYSHQEGQHTRLQSTVNVTSSKYFLKMVKMSTKQIRLLVSSPGLFCLLSGVSVLPILVVLVNRLELWANALLLFCSLVWRLFTLPHGMARELL